MKLSEIKKLCEDKPVWPVFLTRAHIIIPELVAEVERLVEALEEQQKRLCQRACMPHPVVATSHIYECDKMRDALTNHRERWE